MRHLWKLESSEDRRAPFLYFLADAAQDKRIFPRLQRAAARESITPLYQDAAARDLAPVAPYLIWFGDDMRLFNWIWQDGWGRNWGIFLWSQRTPDGVRKHLRTLTKVKTEDGRILLFRFYDPRVLASVLPVLDAAQLREFFGPVSRFMIETAPERSLAEFTLRDGVLKRADYALSG